MSVEERDQIGKPCADLVLCWALEKKVEKTRKVCCKSLALFSQDALQIRWFVFCPNTTMINNVLNFVQLLDCSVYPYYPYHAYFAKNELNMAWQMV